MERLIRIVCFWSVVAALIAGCNRLAEECLDVAEACMETNPDSAYSSLQCLALREDLTGEERARYALLRTQAMHKCRIPLESDSLINVAVEYYTGSDDRHRLALSLLYKGLVHKQCSEVLQAVEAFVMSEQAFEEVEDDQYKALLFNHYASLLQKENLLEKSLEYHKKAYQCELLGDSIHYALSSCGQIAHVYGMMGMPDSSEVYYRQGLSLLGNCRNEKRSSMFLQNYAAFLTNRGQYDEAERILKESEDRLSDSTYIYNVYASLASLYYETGRYEQAQMYGERMLDSRDSLIQCGGFLRLYEIHKRLGEMKTATDYHNLYRHFHSDIVMRRKTAEVAVIPHKLANQELKQENHALIGWKLWLAIVLVVLVLVAIVIYVKIRKKHRFEQAEKDLELTESQASLNEAKHSLAKTQDELVATKVSLGQMKGMQARQGDAVGRVKTVLEETKRKHQKEIARLKDSIKNLEADIFLMKEKERERKYTETELMQNFKMLKKQLKEKTDKLVLIEHQREIDLRIGHFVMHGRDAIAVDMLLQFRYGEEVQARYDIRSDEYIPMLRNLLEQENPALAEQLEKCELERKKLTMCYLMALGLDDVEMMARAACLAPNSVKAYRKECRELVQSLESKV